MYNPVMTSVEIEDSILLELKELGGKLLLRSSTGLFIEVLRFYIVVLTAFAWVIIGRSNSMCPWKLSTIYFSLYTTSVK